VFTETVLCMCLVCWSCQHSCSR